MHIPSPSHHFPPEVNAPASRTAGQTMAHGEGKQYEAPRT